MSITKTATMNYSFIKRGALSLLGLSFVSALLIHCTPDKSDMELGALPDASFTVTPVSGKINTYLLTSTTAGAFMYRWDLGNGVKIKNGKAVDTAYFPFAGSYDVKLTAFGKGGYDSAMQKVTIANDDPNAITPTILLAGRTSKTWKLAPEPQALLIGPSDFGQVWWGNSAADVTGRACQFNDEYIFYANGNFVRDAKGDFYVDEEGGAPHPAGMPAVGCYPISQIPDQFKAWTGGNFTFEFVGDNKLKVNGTGAYLGLYKAANPPTAAATTPQSTITYTVVSLTANRMVLKIDYGWGAWRFTFVSQ
jgi:PKD repeat protein